LTITADAERTTTCRYCEASVFIPDELWRRLHPAKTMRTWTLTYEGKLESKEDIERVAAALAHAQKERLEREQQKLDELAERAEIEREKRSASWRPFLIILAISVAFSLFMAFQVGLFDR
jgi:hypothetical protein